MSGAVQQVAQRLQSIKTLKKYMLLSGLQRYFSTRCSPLRSQPFILIEEKLLQSLLTKV